MNIEIIEYDVYKQYDSYEPSWYVKSFETIEEAVLFCKEKIESKDDYSYHIVLDYKITN